MSTVHPARSSGSLAVFVPAIVAIALLPAPNAGAQQVRLGGGGGSPVTVEFLQDITMTMKPGAARDSSSLNSESRCRASWPTPRWESNTI